MEISKIVKEILKVTNESPHEWLYMDSREAGEIFKIINKALTEATASQNDRK